MAHKLPLTAPMEWARHLKKAGKKEFNRTDRRHAKTYIRKELQS